MGKGHAMKIIKALCIITFVSLLITAGCTTGEKTSGITLPAHNAASPVFSDGNLAVTPVSTVLPGQNATISPGTTTLQESYADNMVGAWKTHVNDNQVVYWQFDTDGTLTGGSSPGSHEITGNWSGFFYKNAFRMQAAGTRNNGNQTMYDVVIGYDLTTGNVSVINPPEDRNWIFVRQS